MRKILEQCPSCGGALAITEVACDACGTQVRSRYAPCPFCALTTDELAFVRLFVAKRGNLRELEKALGVSYPTVRGKLEQIAERLGAAPAPASPTEDPAGTRREVLAMIASGRLTPREGLAILQAGAAEEPGAPDA